MEPIHRRNTAIPRSATRHDSPQNGIAPFVLPILLSIPLIIFKFKRRCIGKANIDFRS